MEAKKGIIDKFKDEALKNSRTLEEMKATNLDLNQKLSTNSAQAKLDVQAMNLNIEKLEKKLTQSELECHNLSLGMLKDAVFEVSL